MKKNYAPPKFNNLAVIAGKEVALAYGADALSKSIKTPTDCQIQIKRRLVFVFL